MKTLYLIRGVPGSGKTTFGQILAQSIGAIQVEADDFFYEYGVYKFDPSKLRQAHEWCQRVCEDQLKGDASVVVSNTSTTEREVETYAKMAELHNAKFVSIIVENRHSGVNVHNVPEDKIQQMKSRFSIKL